MTRVVCEACYEPLERYATANGEQYFNREARSDGGHLLVGRFMFELVPFGSGDPVKGTISAEKARGAGVRYALHESVCEAKPSKPPEMVKTKPHKAVDIEETRPGFPSSIKGVVRGR